MSDTPKTVEEITASLGKLGELTPEQRDALAVDIQATYDAAEADDDVATMESMVDALETFYAFTPSDEPAQPADAVEEPVEEPAADPEPEQPAAEAEPPAEVPDPAAEETPVEEDNDTPAAEVEAPADAEPQAEATPDTKETAPMDEETTEAPLAASGEPEFSPPDDASPVVASVETHVRAGTDLKIRGAGEDFLNLREVSEATVEKINAIKRARGGDGTQHTVATITASFPEDRMLAPGDLEGNEAKIEAVTGEQAIVAAGGYCAPLPVSYNIFGLGTTARPVRDALPGFGATRGGIRFVQPPKLGDYLNAVGLWTAGEDVIAGSTQTISNKALTSNVATLTTSAAHGYVVGETVKITSVGAPFDGTYVIASVPTSTTFTYARTAADVTSAAVTSATAQLVKACLRVTCQSELTATADAVTLCLTFGNMMSRAFPELVQRHNALSLIQHARFAEQTLLTKIAAQCTAVTSAFQVGVARDFLLAIGKAAAAYRNRHRVSRTTPLRVIAPEWVLDAMREDFSLQLPGDDAVATSDAAISAYLSARNVNVSWHMDDTFSAQSTGAIVNFPSTIVWYIFAEGTFLFLDGGTLDLGVIRDSTLVGTNDYQTFVETFEGIAKVGIEAIQVTTTTHVAGSTIGTTTPS